MTSVEGFYFSLLRISMIQLLKAHGFDKAKSSTVDLYTDLYVRYLELLMNEVHNLVLVRRDLDEEVALQDISQAMQNIGMLKPTDVLDVYDENPFHAGDKGMQKFKSWLLEDTPTVDARVISSPTPSLLRASDKNNKPLSIIPEYINQLNVGEKKNTEEQDEAELIEAMINNGDMDDWIRFMISSQQIEASRRKTGKYPKDLESLPPVPGLKYTKLSKTRPVANNAYLPVGVDDEQELDTQNVQPDTIGSLNLKLPISNTHCRLENITVSYDEEKDTVTTDTVKNKQNDVNDAQEDIMHVSATDEDVMQTGGFAMGIMDTTELNEMEDMHNTFERRASLDYGHSYNI